MSLLTLIIYKTGANREPFSRWLSTLDQTVRALILARLKRVIWGILEIANF